MISRLSCLTLLLALCLSTADAAQGDNTPRLEPVDCRFEVGPDWPRSQCFRMHVPENHAEPGGRMISFPVVRFRARFSLWPNRPPVLHLGGGGPGASMYLDSTEAVRSIWEYHDAMSIERRRDLIVIDPRGTGLSQPALVCWNFLQNLVPRLAQNLSMRDEWLAIEQDYERCIDVYLRDGFDLRHYNSRAVASDVEMLRQALDIDRWVLLGVSYATIYAQLVAQDNPGSVESMVLDSATFAHLAGEQSYLRRARAPYRALFDYCRYRDDCRAPLPDFEARLWALYYELNQNPISMQLDHPYLEGRIELQLNGERFLGALLEGIYGIGIYRDLPSIVTELEQRRYRRILPYLESTLQFMFDPTYGDVSMEAHYCFDTRPHINLDHITRQVEDLPDGYFKRMMRLSLEIGDQCERMKIDSGYPPMARARSTEVPTLFLHGRLDPVTLLEDVVSQRRHFRHSRLATFEFSHSMLTSDECAEVVAARFVANPSIEEAALDCL